MHDPEPGLPGNPRISQPVGDQLRQIQSEIRRWLGAEHVSEQEVRSLLRAVVAATEQSLREADQVQLQTEEVRRLRRQLETAHQQLDRRERRAAAEAKRATARQVTP